MNFSITSKERERGLLVILFLGVLICTWQLGSTGLFDETPPLFAAASRAMAATNDWLTPRVNGLPRFDKPPLVYWLMGFFYSLPGQMIWDPLGTWSARLPSALSTILMMLFLGDTVMRWPTKEVNFPRRTAVVTSLAFALSPLVVIWSRIAVSDALLCSTLGISMILIWRSYVNPIEKRWVFGWIILGLAILTKGPIALAISIFSFLIFGIVQRDYYLFLNRIKPVKGILVSLLVSTPWYFLELMKEGQAFWDSFFGYHNFQRLTSVVNSHYEPWWFFGLILIIASLPFTPFLIVGIWNFLNSLIKVNNKTLPENSLFNFAGSWLISILLLFTFAATKLPSYWLPATPAAAIIIGITASQKKGKSLKKTISLLFSTFIIFSFSISLLSLKAWIYRINDPEIPNLSNVLVYSKINIVGAICLLIATFLGVYLLMIKDLNKLIIMQIPLILFQIFFMLPFWKISDNLRQLPIRKVSSLILSSKLQNEPIAMVGINKPSLHFYTNQVIYYEKASKEGVVNLSERLYFEKRSLSKSSLTDISNKFKTILIVIDDKTSMSPFWRGLNPNVLGKYSIYNVWRLDRNMLDIRAKDIRSSGTYSDWREYNPERI